MASRFEREISFLFLLLYLRTCGPPPFGVFCCRGQVEEKKRDGDRAKTALAKKERGGGEREEQIQIDWGLEKKKEKGKKRNHRRDTKKDS